MWTYYGSKTNIIDHYPTPKHDKIIEPFAGTARYSLKYFEKDILLVDKYEVIINIWKWLQKCSVKDIKRLPHFIKPGQSLEEITFDCDETKDLLGFLVGYGMERPRKTASKKRMTDRPNHVNFTLNKIEKNLFKIKHWNIQLGGYDEILNQKATWFIDPPYQFGGHAYVYNNKKINFDMLSDWCKVRTGQIIICENAKANWMDFKPMICHKGAKGKQNEVIWSNHKTNFDIIQKTIQF